MWINTPKFNPIKMMSSNKSIFGVHMGTLKDERILKNHLKELSIMYNSGGIDPIIDSVWDFREIADAQKHMHNRKNKGKILLDFVPQ
jgi:NADPH:quinone reductase-like Zn-dependent oxidoreductase